MPYRNSLASVMVVFTLAGCAGDGEDDDAWGEQGSDEGALVLEGFEEPTDDEVHSALERHPQVDPERVVPRALLERAVAFADKNADRIDNKQFVSVIDFSKHSGKRRFFIVNMDTGRVDAHVVAHGSGSDPNNTGFASRFSNRDGSNASSLGYYVTGETYQGRHGRSLRLDGVSDTNSNARSRAVVIHSADYVEEGRRQQGRSWGCPAVANDVRDSIINRLKNGSVIYADLSER